MTGLQVKKKKEANYGKGGKDAEGEIGLKEG